MILIDVLFIGRLDGFFICHPTDLVVSARLEELIGDVDFVHKLLCLGGLGRVIKEAHIFGAAVQKGPLGLWTESLLRVVDLLRDILHLEVDPAFVTQY